jgi:hypothetical protein
MAKSAAVIKNTTPFQDSANGADGGRMGYATAKQVSMDCRGTVFTQVARFFKLAADHQHEVLNRLIGTSNEMSHVWAIIPVNLLERVISCMMNPMMNRTYANPKLLGYLMH